MNAILYLIRKDIKNRVLEMFHHPSKLILYVALIILLGTTLFSANSKGGIQKNFDMRILQGAYLGVLTVIAALSILGGLKSGTTFFKLSDVNYLFVSPVSPKRILAYGMVKQAASSMLMVFFLLFYSGTMSNAFGITPPQTLDLVLGVAVLIFMIQVITLLVYTYSNGRSKRIRRVKICVYSLLGAAVVYICASFLRNGSSIQALYDAVSSPYLEFIPVAGWIKGMVFSIINQNTVNIILFLILNAVALIGSVLLFINSDSDYYEDVLQTTIALYQLKGKSKAERTHTINKKQKR